LRRVDDDLGEGEGEGDGEQLAALTGEMVEEGEGDARDDVKDRHVKR
jgi:hypothetical protein